MVILVLEGPHESVEHIHKDRTSELRLTDPQIQYLRVCDSTGNPPLHLPTLHAHVNEDVGLINELVSLETEPIISI